LRLFGIALLLLSATIASAAGQDGQDDECESLGGTVQRMATWLKGDADEEEGIRAASCYVDDPLFGQSRFDLVLHANRDYDIGHKAKLRYNGRIIEIFERPQCAGGGVVVNGSPVSIRGNQAKILDVMSGGMGTIKKLQWVSETLLRWPVQSYATFEAALTAKPIGTCTFGEEFGRWYDQQLYGSRRRSAP
jgi:hypothetical protein